MAFVAGARGDGLLPNGSMVGILGGEAMVAASESGYLETEMIRAFPRQHLRFRCLAWEGDTVFEQKRDLNFPSLEAQLDQIGAAVVVAQFGEMESVEGEAKVAMFVGAYEQLIDRVSAGGKRRVVLVGSMRAPALSAAQEQRHEAMRLVYSVAVQDLAKRRGLLFVAAVETPPKGPGVDRLESREKRLTEIGRSLALQLSGKVGMQMNPEVEGRWQTLRPAIEAKNRLWFNYWRPQNWAFLNGDRTAQPSSRDHLDPSKRWFPAEMEEFIPLIEKREREIDALAAKLAQP